MGFADKVRAKNNTAPYSQKLPWILTEMGDKDGGELLEVIADPTVQPVAIHRTLRAQGFEISLHSVGDWCRKARP